MMPVIMAEGHTILYHSRSSLSLSKIQNPSLFFFLLLKKIKGVPSFPNWIQSLAFASSESFYTLCAATKATSKRMREIDSSCEMWSLVYAILLINKGCGLETQRPGAFYATSLGWAVSNRTESTAPVQRTMVFIARK